MGSYYLQINTEEPEVIKPASPTKKCALYLNNFDQQVFFHVEMLLVYDVGHGEYSIQLGDDLRDDGGAMIERLREALSKALVAYYPAAGRYRINEEEARLEIDCGEQGALLAVARSSSSIAELGDLDAPNPEFRRLLLYPKSVKSMEEVPLLTVQVTRFRCGGFILGFFISHVVMDGISISDFLHDFATITRGEAVELAPRDPDRSCFRHRSPPLVTRDHPELAALPATPAKLLFNPSSWYDATAPLPIAFKTFSFTARDLAALKSRALAEGSLNSCSTFQALTAHVWRARTAAMGLDPAAISKLFVVISIRDKLKAPPHFPERFLGNGVIAAPCVNTTAAELRENSLTFAVRRIQETIASVDEGYIRSELDWCHVKGHGIIDLPGGMIITTWSRLGFDSVDFGCGRPAYVAAPVNDRREYVLVLSSCKNDGGVNLFMGMDFDKMAKLEALLKV
ncbi:BAHD family acyltransferase, clade V [Selaginella moellendorffii]|uniref:BAHD family acyltransferase, clade V n=1 Tax=Selaginella moellendorffii TaxID=88036 RepID=D8QVD2_SELML|nr:omega-hydroxypalmitate O-feruloyl transferase [Selaginella moellendorffii]EFJ36435.1 BAHD family acyltransferase, clade V [Selaginella moellendorffii]|eukprot:XP_002962972.1 omega-hydroxypalmitate O-feruloyl transferase [Selaginella moellendorffii]